MSVPPLSPLELRLLQARIWCLEPGGLVVPSEGPKLPVENAKSGEEAGW
jgi:hypothetical protein